MKKLTVTDVLVTVIVAVVFGIVYKIWGPMYDVVKPIGLHAEQTVYGMWFIAATFAYLIIRKPGVALLAELSAASVSMLLGGEWGVATLVYGLFQGLGAELVFACTRYRSAKTSVIVVASLGAGIASLVIDAYYGYFDKLVLWNLALLIGLRLLGSVLLAGFLAVALARAVEKTGVTALLRPVRSSDFDGLH